VKFRGRRFSISYFILEPPVKFGLRVFFRRYSATGMENIPPANTPTIIIANHQNGMMDPFMACAFTPQQLHWLTRADVFKSPLAYKFLTSVNMLPIYRERDKVADKGDKNEAIFQECYDRISNGNTVCLFPEGNHNHVKHLRMLKKGAARLAFGTMESKGRDLDVQIIPLGIEYGAFNLFRSDLLLNFGKPISMQKYLAAYDKNPATAINGSVQEMHTVLSDIIIDIKSPSLVDLCDNSRYISTTVMLDKQGKKASLQNEFLAYQTVVKKLIGLERDHQEKLDYLDTLSQEFRAACDKQGLRIDEHERATIKLGQHALFAMALILLFPIAVLGIILNGIPAYLIHEFVKNKVNDIHFKSSIMFFLGIFTIPIFWLFEYLIFALLLQNWIVALLLFPSALLTAIGAINFWETWKILKAMAWIKKGIKGKDTSALRANETRDEIYTAFSELIKL
jgi:1-acyl-sn-glycerol-3-phosphate acyltransferase